MSTFLPASARERALRCKPCLPVALFAAAYFPLPLSVSDTMFVFIYGFLFFLFAWKDEYGNRKTPSKSTGLPVKGNKKRVEAMAMQARKESENW